MKPALAVVAVLGAVAALTVALPGQSTNVDALKKELEALKVRTAALERELGDLRSKLGLPNPPSPDNPISLTGAKIRGSASAKVMLLEFSDYQCPFCGRHFRETMPQIEKAYIETGKIRYGFKDFPIESLHRQAVKAHEAANCAADQDKYWPMHSRLFLNPNPLGPEELKSHAGAVGVNLDAFQKCVDSGKHVQTVQDSINVAVSFGVSGTPAFFVGVVSPDGKSLKPSRFISGAHPFTRFKQEIDALLSSSN